MHLHLKLLLLSQNISKGSAYAVGETLIKDRYMLHTLWQNEGAVTFSSPRRELQCHFAPFSHL